MTNIFTTKMPRGFSTVTSISEKMFSFRKREGRGGETPRFSKVYRDQVWRHWDGKIAKQNNILIKCHNDDYFMGLVQEEMLETHIHRHTERDR